MGTDKDVREAEARRTVWNQSHVPQPRVRQAASSPGSGKERLWGWTRFRDQHRSLQMICQDKFCLQTLFVL